MAAISFSDRNLSRAKVLFVDDDEAIRTAFGCALERAGYEVIVASNGLDGLALTKSEKPALVLLDVDMPESNGWQMLAALRGADLRVPVIMLTGHTHIDDRINGLSGGADDYICKPCDLRELLARVHAALRRSAPPVTSVRVLHFGATRVDLANRTMHRAGIEGGLTRTEYEMLEFFSRHRSRLVTRKEILESVWGYDRQPNTRTIDTHIWRLRRKLDDSSGDSRWIQTVTAGDGYRMVSD